MLVESELRYRLRQSSRVVGYMRIINGKTRFYSRDTFWWSGNPIEHDITDEATAYRDKNNKVIYEWDILRYKVDPDDDYEQGVVLWNERQKRFGILSIQNRIFYPFEINGVGFFNPQQLEVFSFLFINPELQAELGLADD